MLLPPPLLVCAWLAASPALSASHGAQPTNGAPATRVTDAARAQRPAKARCAALTARTGRDTAPRSRAAPGRSASRRGPLNASQRRRRTGSRRGRPRRGLGLHRHLRGFSTRRCPTPPGLRGTLRTCTLDASVGHWTSRSDFG